MATLNQTAMTRDYKIRQLSKVW